MTSDTAPGCSSGSMCPVPGTSIDWPCGINWSNFRIAPRVNACECSPRTSSVGTGDRRTQSQGSAGVTRKMAASHAFG